jgi:hypothetical protein
MSCGAANLLSWHSNEHTAEQICPHMLGVTARGDSDTKAVIGDGCHFEFDRSRSV